MEIIHKAKADTDSHIVLDDDGEYLVIVEDRCDGAVGYYIVLEEDEGIHNPYAGEYYWVDRGEIECGRTLPKGICLVSANCGDQKIIMPDDDLADLLDLNDD